MITTSNIKAIEAELKRLCAWGPAGIEIEAGPDGTVWIYDTQMRSCFDAEVALAALRDADADGWPGGGFEAAWQALGGLAERRDSE